MREARMTAMAYIERFYLEVRLATLDKDIRREQEKAATEALARQNLNAPNSPSGPSGAILGSLAANMETDESVSDVVATDDLTIAALLNAPMDEDDSSVTSVTTVVEVGANKPPSPAQTVTVSDSDSGGAGPSTTPTKKPWQKQKKAKGKKGRF